tara:strand:+ start:4078 stop:4485 length:408 start_codon:yes stop_codon:yes gene_type:complete
MKDWKARQAAYHAYTSMMNIEHTDDLNKFETVISSDIVKNALRHFKEHVNEWIYPAKSYAVAICYAKWLERDYGEDFYAALDDEDLLFGNDPYFKPYYESKSEYDAILAELDFKEDMGMVPDIHEYYKEEMLYGL